MVVRSVRSLKHITAGCFAMAMVGAASAACAASERVVYSFKGGSDGAVPYAGLLDVDGKLYGTTSIGGAVADKPGICPVGCGTVFKVTRAGTETVLHAFEGGSDGATPYAGLINVGGTLYGTTQLGGSYGYGTVFKVTKTGTETVLYAFKGYSYSDGAAPVAGLAAVDGALYGTTSSGGRLNNGTVFRLTQAGAEKVLYDFTDLSDGAFPSAGLIDMGGALYGTTYGGGTGACSNSSYGCGTVFKVTKAGVYTVMHAFPGNFSDGANPYAGLVKPGGTLYGTTPVYGATGNGAIFKLTSDGAETLAYSFKGGSDGAWPQAGLIDVGGALYGTTYSGGASGNGTVFKLAKNGVETVVYAFKGGSDGAGPWAGLVNIGGTLYGTTYSGGASGNGTVFAVTP